MKNKILALVAVAAASLALSGCVPSKLAEQINDKERAEYQSKCMEVRGTFAGNMPWEVPSCTVIYDYPSVPDRINPPDGD